MASATPGPNPNPSGKPPGKGGPATEVVPPPAPGPTLEATGVFAESTPDPLVQTAPIPPGDTVPPPAPTQQMVANDSESATPALAEEAKVNQAATTLKDFRLLQKLGEGGMGAVYKAHQISLDRVVAVKVPFRHLAKDASFVGRFYREARVMARLDHPHILRCYSVGEENGWHYLAMEFIDGASMQSWLEKLGKLSVPDALHVTLACAHALQHAHDQGMVHRDIKPDNILVTTKGIVKVADMGLAKALEDDLGLSRTGTGAGTPHYMAPEQAQDAKHVDGRSDIYALGSMLYCFLTGRPPFKGDTYVELLMEKQKGKHTPARRVNPDVPERLDLMIDKMLAAKPEHRYKSCAELIRDLEALHLASETLSFIPGAVVPPVRAMGQPTKPVASKPTQVAAKSPAGTAPAAAGQAVAKAGDVWYLRSVTEKGKVVKRKLTTAQIINLIKEKDFDIDCEASRTLKGPYRNLNYYREFQHALTGRLAQAKADKKTAEYKNMYENVLKDEHAFYRRRWLKNMFRSATGLVSFLIFLAILGVVAFFAVRWFFSYFSI
jgi:serine/threonine-protein kinase